MRRKKLVFICIFVLLIGLGCMGYVLYARNNKYCKAKDLLENGKYQEAYNTFKDINDYKDVDVLMQATKSILENDFDSAIDLLKGDQKYNELVKYITIDKNETYYNMANKCVENKDYITARDYYNQIIDYKDSKERLSEIDDLATYYEAIEYEKTSMVEALNLLKTLPEDMFDVKDKIERLESYCACTNIYGKIGGYQVTGIKIEDFYIEGNQIMMKSDSWKTIPVKKSSDSSYDYYGEWAGKEIYISPSKVKITYNGDTNILKTDGSVDENIPTGKKNRDSSSNGTCPNCGGTGFVKFYYGASDFEAYMDGFDPYELGDCPMCHGTGKAY